MVSKMEHTRNGYYSMKDYKLLDDEKIVNEMVWLISLHLERFDCKDNTLPCQPCMNRARKIAPLFLIGIEGLADNLFRHPRTIIQTVMDKISQQKWRIRRPWTSDKTPAPYGETIYLPLLGSLVEQNQEKPKDKPVKYRLVKRHKDAL